MALHDDDPGAERPDRDATLNVSRRVFLKTVGARPSPRASSRPARRDAQSGPPASGPARSPSSSPSTASATARRSSRASRCSTPCATRSTSPAQSASATAAPAAPARDPRRPHGLRLLDARRRGCRASTIRTVEGLAQGTVLHPVQQAFCENDGADVRLLHAGLRRGHRRAAREEPERRRRSRPGRRSTATSAAAARIARILEAALNGEGGAPWLTNPQVPGSLRRPVARHRRRPARRSTRGRPKPTLLGKRSQAARRPGQGHRPREVHATTSSGPACCTAGSCARRTRTPRSSSIDLGRRGEGAGREGGDRLDREAGRQGDVLRATRSPRVAADTEDQARDARAADQGRVRGAAAPRDDRAGDARRARRRCSRAATSRPAQTEEAGDLDAGFKAAAHVVEASLRDAGADARVARDARLRLRVGRRQAHGVGRRRRRCTATREGFATGARDPAGQRPRDHRVHGRRLRQQVRAGRAGHRLREAGEAGEGAGEADARSQGRASRDRQPPVGDARRSAPA